ncbi:hypothetical protein TELCIR_00553 [Teladorsagia circumcincta]|uniref:Receptor ligand binding region domain-containing protein n=1 Tax=Teladorsagia circumcincta TaxID=45464 RepID=A0A2G9V4G1_TELCI|nr:hypothetical protein TELCIR_00553 [Teladorsagia circumcincta]
MSIVFHLSLLLFLLPAFAIDLTSSRKDSLRLPTKPSEKQKVNIALVYQHYANRSKAYDKAFKEVIRKINDGTSISSLRRLATKYTFGAVDCILPTGMFLVRDVLNCICHTIVKNKVALVIFVTASETYDSTTSAEQYFLTLTAYTGIPVIAWNADNSGFTFGKDLTPFRIIQMAPPIEHQIRSFGFSAESDPRTDAILQGDDRTPATVQLVEIRCGLFPDGWFIGIHQKCPS